MIAGLVEIMGLRGQLSPDVAGGLPPILGIFRQASPDNPIQRDRKSVV